MSPRPAGAPSDTLADALAHARIWRGDGLALPALPGLESGFAELDAALPGGGWPSGAITEIFLDHEGIGELALILPALVRVARASRGVAWVMPAAGAPPKASRARPAPRSGTRRGERDEPLLRPKTPGACPLARSPYAPALVQAGLDPAQLIFVAPQTSAEAAWALRQIIASGACGAVVGWLDRADSHSLRRLQITAEGSAAAVLLFRPAARAHEASVSALKLLLEPAQGGRLAVSVLKRRGTPLAAPVVLEIPRPALATPQRAEPGPRPRVIELVRRSA